MTDADPLARHRRQVTTEPVGLNPNQVDVEYDSPVFNLALYGTVKFNDIYVEIYKYECTRCGATFSSKDNAGDHKWAAEANRGR